MYSRPKINIVLTKFDSAVEMASLALLVLLWIATTAYYLKLPDQIPTHFNTSGDADDVASISHIFLLPVVAIITYVGLTWLNRHPHIYNYPGTLNAENAEQRYTAASRVIRVLKLCIMIVFAGIVFLKYYISKTGGNGLGGWFVVFATILLVLPNVYFLFKQRASSR